MPKKTAPKISNRLPRCVAVELQLRPTAIATDSYDPFATLPPDSEVSIEMFDIKLTINFGVEHEISVPARNLFPSGYIKFGLNRSTLNLQLENCEIPLSKVHLVQDLNLSVDYEVSEEKAKKMDVGIAIEESKVIAKAASEQSTKTSHKFKQTQTRIHMTGYDTSYSWIFETIGHEDVLEGFLREQALATLHIINKPCNLIATIEGNKEDIRLTEGQFGWIKDITKNKWAVIERAIAFKIVANQLQPNISEVTWCYD